MRYGLGFAVIYAALGLVIALVTGGRALEANRLDVWQMLLSYLVGGMVAGLIVGLLLPVGRWLVGAMFLGYVAAVPVGFVFELVDAASLPGREIDVVGPFIWAGALGVVGGAGLWLQNRRT